MEGVTLRHGPRCLTNTLRSFTLLQRQTTERKRCGNNPLCRSGMLALGHRILFKAAAVHALTFGVSIERWRI